MDLHRAGRADGLGARVFDTGESTELIPDPETVLLVLWESFHNSQPRMKMRAYIPNGIQSDITSNQRAMEGFLILGHDGQDALRGGCLRTVIDVLWRRFSYKSLLQRTRDKVIICPLRKLDYFSEQ